jgi:hypothetical protein
LLVDSIPLDDVFVINVLHHLEVDGKNAGGWNLISFEFAEDTCVYMRIAFISASMRLPLIRKGAEIP